ncbi:MAG: thioredoxin-like domain-containing protein [Steroidobacteraceae bacterium]
MTRRTLLIAIGTCAAVVAAVYVWSTRPWPAYLIARNWAVKQHDAGRPVDLAGLRVKLLAYLRTQPESAEAYWRAYTYFYLLSGAEGSPADVQPFLDSPYDKIAALARAQLQKIEAIETPVRLQFTALDGRFVDLEQMRGKVVLLDFWATWCTPCLQELPNVKSVYDKYHDRGFEIIGISLDQTDDKQHLLDFLRENDVLWPQHFAGEPETAKNEIAHRFGVRGIPSTFLLDRQGMASASTVGVFGVELEPKVRELLGLDTGS